MMIWQTEINGGIRYFIYDELKWLMMPVVARYQVCADFVLQQRFDSPARYSCPAADEQSIARDHKAGVHVFAHGNGRREIGASLLIVAKFLLRALHVFLHLLGLLV